jgi:hypothetical protein
MSRTGPVTKDTSTVALGLAQIRVGSAAANIASIIPVLAAADSIGALASTKFTSAVDYWKLESGFPMLEDLTLPIREAAMLECEFKEITPYNLALARGIDVNADVDSDSSEVGAVTTIGTTTGVITTDNLGGVVADTWTVLFLTATTGLITGAVTGHVHDFSDLSSIMDPDDGAQDYFSLPANFFSGTWAADETYVFSTSPFVAGSAAYGDVHSGSINLGALSAPEFVRMEAVYTYPNGVNTMIIIFPRANCTTSVEIDLQSEDNANVPLTFEAKRADDETSGGDAAWNAMTLGRIVFA